MAKVIINPEFGTADVAIQMGVRMLKSPTMSIQDILDFTDNEVLLTVEDGDVDSTSDVETETVVEDEVVYDENSDVTGTFEVQDEVEVNLV
jgi:hypothetical protein